MPYLNDWIGATNTTYTPTEADRATDAWQRIQDNSANQKTVGVRRGGAHDHNEVVRVEWDNSTTEAGQRENTVAVTTSVVVFGVIGHPDAGVSDTDIIEGDELGIDGEVYQVKDVAKPLGELQARCVRIT